MIKRKGGYRGDQRYRITFHASPNLRATLMNLAEESSVAVAWVVRGLVEKALKDDHSLPRMIAVQE